MITAMNLSPLSGKTILLTRAEHQLAEVDQRLRAIGAIPVHFPCLAVEPLIHEIDAAVAQLATYSDVLFTSSNGVISFEKFCSLRGLEPAVPLAGKRISAVGEQTAAMLAAIGIRVDIIPAVASQDGLIDSFRQHGLPHGLLFFRAEEGRDALADALKAAGVVVKTIPVYRTVCPDMSADSVIAMLADKSVDAVLLGSAKTARHYLQRIGSIELANRPVIVTISEAMADQTRSLGLDVQVVAKSASFEAMLNALAGYYDSNPS